MTRLSERSIVANFRALIYSQAIIVYRREDFLLIVLYASMRRRCMEDTRQEKKTCDFVDTDIWNAWKFNSSAISKNHSSE